MAEEEENDEQPVPETGAVFTFGRSRFADNVPNRFWIRNDPIKQVACGDEHTLLLTKSGRVFSFGANDWGQLGHGNSKVYTKPTSIKALKGIPVHLIACGRSHSIVASEKRSIMAFGQNNDGQLGVGDTEQHHSPVVIEDLNDRMILEASGGAQHSAVLTDTGLFVWGSNAEGQLGIPEAEEEILRPVQLKFPEQITHVSCGYYHTAIVTSEGNLFTFGEGEGGKLGHPVRRNEMVKEPRLVDISDHVTGVACGGRHTIAVTRTGELYAFGDGSDGQLGLGDGVTELEGPRQLDLLDSEKIVHVACGESHSAAISDQQQIFVWGNDQYGKLGIIEDLNDHQNKYFEPRRLQKFARFEVLQVSCGGCHTIILAKPCTDQGDYAHDQSHSQLQFMSETADEHMEELKRQWNEQEKENIDQQEPIDGNKLPKLISEENAALQSSMNARARRRRQLSVNNTAGSHDHPSSLADRALSISTDVDRSLNGTSYTKSAITDICPDAGLLRKFERPAASAESDDEAPAVFRTSLANGRRDSNTEMLHKEINRSLTVFCRGDPMGNSNDPSSHKMPHQDEHPADEDGPTDTRSLTNSNHRSAVYARQSAPVPSVPATRITAVAQKYANEAAINDPTVSMSHKSRYIADTENPSGSYGIANSSNDLNEFGQPDRSDEDDPGLSMRLDNKRRSSHDSELAEETRPQGKISVDTVGEPLPDVRQAFTEGTGQTGGGSRKSQGPIKRITNFIARAKEAKAANTNGEDHATRKNSGTGSKSRACAIL